MVPGGFLMVREGIVWVAIVAVLFAAVTDVRRFIIPNWVCLVLLALGVVHAILMPGFPWLGHMLAAVVVFCFGLALFSVRLVGGGDAKLLTVLAFWSGFEDLVLLLLATVLAGGVLSLVYLGRAWWQRLRGTDVGSLLQVRVPYGVAIAVGGLYVFLTIPVQTG